MKSFLAVFALIAMMGIPFAHEPYPGGGNTFGKAVSDLAKSAPGALANHIK